MTRLCRVVRMQDMARQEGDQGGEPGTPRSTDDGDFDKYLEVCALSHTSSPHPQQVGPVMFSRSRCHESAVSADSEYRRINQIDP